MNFSDLTKTLQKIKEELGLDTLKDHRATVGAVMDYLPGHSFERNMVDLLHMSGAVELLMNAEEEGPERRVAVNQAQSLLISHWGMNPESAEALVSAFASAIYESAHYPSDEKTVDVWSMFETDNEAVGRSLDDVDSPLTPVPTDSVYFEFYSNGDGTCAIEGNDLLWEAHLTELIIPEKSPQGERVTEINVMGECPSVKDLYIPEGIELIGSAAFTALESLESLRISASVEDIAEGAFVNCEKLKTITVDPNNKVYSAEGNCLVHIPDKTLILGCAESRIPANGRVLNIAPFAFSGCREMTACVIPEGVRTISRVAFHMCPDLASVSFPSSVTVIRSPVFEGCPRVAEITVAPGNSKYHSFGQCVIQTASKKLVQGCAESSIPHDGSVLTIGMEAFCSCKSLQEISLPDCIQQIGQFAFASSGLKRIRIPRETSVIEDTAFYLCDDLEEIEVHELNTTYHDHSNCLVHTASGTLVLCAQKGAIPSDGSVTVLGSHAFTCARGITRLVIPYYVTTLGENCFSGCTRLANIMMLKEIREIRDQAFFCCESLQQITIPASVTHMGKRVFSGCNQLANIFYQGTTAQWKAIQMSDRLDAEGCPVHCQDGTLTL